MLSRSSKTRKKVAKPAAVTVIKPEQKKVSVVEPAALDLSKAKITIIKPDAGLKVMVEEENEGESE